MNKKIGLIILGVFVICIGVVAGLLFNYFNRPQNWIVRNSLPRQFANSLSLQALFANVNGTIVEKGSDYVILKKGDVNIKAYSDGNVGLSTFIDSVTGKEISFSDLKVNDKLSGGIGILVSNSSSVGLPNNHKQGDIILHYMEVSR
jgi:hypothetical protein